jgi:palmitoyl-protein thioesterase
MIFHVSKLCWAALVVQLLVHHGVDAAATVVTPPNVSSSCEKVDVAAICTQDDEWQVHPTLCHILQRLQNDDCNHPIVSHELYQFADASGWLVDLRSNHDVSLSSSSLSTETSTSSLRHQQRRKTEKENDSQPPIPVVIAHGMGDSCFNSGMVHITQLISEWLNDAYTICIPIGSTQSEDTNNGYFLNMDASVDYFAQQVQQNVHLLAAGTFHAIGFSQGNNIIRGYIAKYNVPIPVHTFISINGVNAGIGAVPHCRPKELVMKSRDSFALRPSSMLSSVAATPLSLDVAMSLCDLLMEQASHAAYTTFAQQHSFQANYWRDPRPSMYDTYRTYSQLAVWSNEVMSPSLFNESLRNNWSKTSKFVWVMADDDTMVWPPQGEQWGAPDPSSPFQHILARNETVWYEQDLFGLRTAELQSKNYYESFTGDHLQFTAKDLHRWIDTYFHP